MKCLSLWLRSILMTTIVGALPVLGGDVYSVTADGQTFDAYFEDYDGQSWMLIGRGRRNWEFDTDGQGSVDDVSQNLKVPAGFAPACYSDAIVNDLFSQAGMTFPDDVEVRIMRATTIDGTGIYQDVRWTNLGGTAFTFVFNVNPGISVTHTLMNGADTPIDEGTYTTADTNTRDNGGNQTRMFTWDHQGTLGFRYGNSVPNNSADTSYLYASYPAGYTELYIPYEVPPQGDISFSDLVSSNVTDEAASLYATANTNLTSATVLWNIEDKGDTNLAVWVNSTSATGTTPGMITGDATNLTADTMYYFRFYGEDSAVPTNGWSGAKTFATALTDASKPVFTSTNSTFNSVTLGWDDNAATETGYVLQRSTNDVDYAVVAELDPDTTSHEDTGLQSEVTYYYQLAATNSANGSSTAFSACVTNATTLFMPAVTTYIGPAGRYDRDTWNVEANWDAGIPSASQNAVIEAGRYASASKAVSGVDTPAYTGDLTMEANSDLELGSSANAVDYNVLGTPGSTTIFMNEGAFMTIRAGGSPSWPALQLLGNAGLNIGTSTGASSDPNFDYGITGPYALDIWGKSGCDMKLTVSNNFAALTTGYDPWTPGGFNIWAQAADSLPSVVTINENPNNGLNTAVLIIDSADAMPDTGVLSLNGGSTTKLTMNQPDTIGSLTVNGFPYPTGTYGRTDLGSVDFEYSWITGNGILTVTSAPTDNTPPTATLVDDTEGGPVFPGQPVSYTVTFSEPVTPDPVPSDFGNASSTGIAVDSVTRISDIAYQVAVSATEVGTLQLQIKSGVAIDDLFGNALVTPVTDDDTLTVNASMIKGQLGRWKPWVNGGINPATGLAWAIGDTYHLAFVSSGTRDATDPDIATYNTFVNAAADAAGMGDATWNCIAATWNDTSRDANAPQMTTSLCIILADGATKLADDGADLSNGPDHYFNITEIEGEYNGNVATGGGRLPGDPNQSKIEHGNSTRTDAAWWRVYNGSQTSQWHWYAISEELTLMSDAAAGTLIILR